MSPDGRFVAYDSEETGRREVYIQSFPDPIGRWRASTGGGYTPAWREDGAELYYVTPESELVAVSVGRAENSSGDDQLELGTPEVLFEVDLKRSDRREYDTVDGKTFLLNRNVHAGTRTPLTLVLHALERQ